MAQEKHKSLKLHLRALRESDYPDIKRIMNQVYPGMGAWSKTDYKKMLAIFPEGQICIEANQKVVAAALSIIVQYEKFSRSHTYLDVIGKRLMDTHDPNGDYLYGIDLFVDPEYRDLRLGRRLYDARKELCEHLNLKGILIGGRIPGYHKYKDQMDPLEYIKKVKNQEIHDPVLTFQLNNDFYIKQVLKNYLPGDSKSASHAVLLEWNNIYYEEKPLQIGKVKTNIRLGVIQWQMRIFDNVDQFMDQVEFFIDTVSGYGGDIILFPELFNAPLMAKFDQEQPVDAMKKLAQYSDEIRDRILKLALSYNINVIAGSVPVIRNGLLHNVSYLLRRDGTWDVQFKLHITPDEQQYWGFKGGNELKIFETDVGKIGILICFDVEFPELSRVLAENGVNLILVPYWTDTKNGYLRVRRCAQARAIENECYVAISGSVGNIPRIENMDIQYSQSAVFTPSDFPFPHDAIKAEATPNTEMVLIADLDLELLKEMREQGSVRNLHSRRLDLYQVAWMKNIYISKGNEQIPINKTDKKEG
jgi:predicted amidohydrolase/ribosomal protein S18 acetylase RimI-like enzyme